MVSLEIPWPTSKHIAVVIRTVSLKKSIPMNSKEKANMVVKRADQLWKGQMASEYRNSKGRLMKSSLDLVLLGMGKYPQGAGLYEKHHGYIASSTPTLSSTLARRQTSYWYWRRRRTSISYRARGNGHGKNGRWGLPCVAAFACTDYKVQSRTLDRVALELRGTQTTMVNRKP